MRRVDISSKRLVFNAFRAIHAAHVGLAGHRSIALAIAYALLKRAIPISAAPE
jgi:hypothetical protein